MLGAAIEAAYSELLLLDLWILIAQVQNGDLFLGDQVKRIAKRHPRHKGVEHEWSLDLETRVLYEKNLIPLPQDPALIKELLRIHHNDPCRPL